MRVLTVPKKMVKHRPLTTGYIVAVLTLVFILEIVELFIR